MTRAELDKHLAMQERQKAHGENLGEKEMPTMTAEEIERA